MRRLLKLIGLLLVLAIAYLFLWPTDVAPQVWQPQREPELTGVLAPNRVLSAADVLFPDIVGPEAIAVDANGRLVTGLADGRLVTFTPSSSEVTTFTATSGRPLGIKLDRDGSLIVADAVRGLLRVDREGGVHTLATEVEGGGKLVFTDDLDIAADGTIYFTDASTHFGLARYRMAILEHGGDGRLLAYHPKNGKVELVAGGLDFANGVALAPDGSYLLVTETSSYRIRRFWLTGNRRGKDDVFADNLPAFPDNITWSPSRKLFWVGCGSPRITVVDRLAPYPVLRKALARLPEVIQPAPEKHAFVLGYDEDGRLVHALQDPDGHYAPIASVLEHDGWLYLGSFKAHGVARVRAP